MIKHSSTNNLDSPPQTINPIRNKAENYSTGSSYNIDRSFAAKFSTLAGGNTKQQVASDLFSTLGLTAGSTLGGMVAKKYFSRAIDRLDDYMTKPQLNSIGSTIVDSTISKIPGHSPRAKAMKAPLYKIPALLSLLSNMPKNVKYPGLMGLSLVLGGGLAGGVTGGVIGHHVYKPGDMPSS